MSKPQVQKLGVSALVVIGTGHARDGRRITPDTLDTAHDAVADRFRQGITRLADGTGHWLEKPSIRYKQGRKVEESNRAYVIVGKDIEEVFVHAEFIANRYDQQSVFVTIGSMGYEVFSTTNVS